jgi:hypothetical protein
VGVHLYLYSNDVTEVPCPQGFSDAPKEGALCHAISGADGKFTFRSLPCGKLIIYIELIKCHLSAMESLCRISSS